MTQVMQCLVYQFTTETCSEEIIIMHLIMHYYSRVFQPLFHEKYHIYFMWKIWPIK
jgi:hypothetical protein